MKLIYSTKQADKHPIWGVRPDGSVATMLETLHYQMAIDGSRASWVAPPNKNADKLLQ